MQQIFVSIDSISYKTGLELSFWRNQYFNVAMGAAVETMTFVVRAMRMNVPDGTPHPCQRCKKLTPNARYVAATQTFLYVCQECETKSEQ